MATPAMDLASINLNDRALFERNDHHEVFRVLRRERPVHWNAPTKSRQGFWAITRYHDMWEISRRPDLFASSSGIIGAVLRPEAFVPGVEEDPTGATFTEPNASIITMDPPRHVKMRRLVNKGFTPRAVNAMEPEIRRVANEILDGITPRGECDFVVDVAAQLPLAVICGMMGIAREDWQLMFDLSNMVLGAADPEYQAAMAAADGEPVVPRQTAMSGYRQLYEYFGRVLEERRSRPPADDMVSLLIEAEVDGESLTETDILTFCFLLVLAGNETTRNAISGGMEALSAYPEQKARLLADMSLLDSAIEEILRWVSPVHHMARTVVSETEVRGQQLRAGERVLLWYPSANRDEEVFEDPFRFDITRSPNEHLAFGIGEHFCLGAGFARMELKVMFQELFRRFPDIEVVGPASRLRSNFLNGMKHLPVRYTPAS